MALPLPSGLTPAEVGFLCEMELVTVIPRQKLSGLELLGGPTEPLKPPFPAALPLWLALLLKRQKRANILPPPWLHVSSLEAVLDFETSAAASGVLLPSPSLPPPKTPVSVPDEPYLSQDTLCVSPPFVPDACTSSAAEDALPYHWLEMAHLLLTHAAEDFSGEADAVRRLVQDLRDVRMSKLRKGFRVLEAGAGVKMNGVGGMEIAEVRGFVGGVVDGLRRIGRSREEARRERMDEDGSVGLRDDDDDDDMEL